jgi:hypothetical protein
MALLGGCEDTFSPPDARVIDAMPDVDAAVDVEAPTVAFVEPIEGQDVTGVVAIALDARDDTGVTRVDLFVDALPLDTLTAPPFESAWDSTGFPDGSYALRAVASDRTGKTGEAIVRIDVVAAATRRDMCGPASHARDLVGARTE